MVSDRSNVYLLVRVRDLKKSPESLQTQKQICADLCYKGCRDIKFARRLSWTQEFAIARLTRYLSKLFIF